MFENTSIHSICVYCGSADGLATYYLEAAAEMGRLLAQNSIRLVYGAGKTGMMGALADSVLANNGQVTGITPENLNTPQLIHAGLTSLEVVPDIHVRKARMSALADAFIALPGGFGTLDELFESLTWAQIGLHAKPIGILNTRGYYDPLVEMINQARRDGFIYSEHEQLFVTDPNPAGLLQKLGHFNNPAGLDRWVNRD